MAYKTVLVHLNNERRAARLIAFATEFAETHGSHLIGLFVVPLPVVLNEWPDIAIAEMIEAQRKAHRDEGKRVGALFREKTKHLSRPSEWRVADSQYATASDALVLNARAADIVIAPQADADWPLTHIFDVADAAILESGRPVLVIPSSGGVTASPARVTVAWNSRRESTRAAFDAIPILQNAAATEVVWADPRVGSNKAGDLPCAELAATLARHGVRSEAKVITAEDSGVGEALLTCAKDSKSDLLVIGAYGHSRLREFVLGSATRQVLKGLSLPVFFSH